MHRRARHLNPAHAGAVLALDARFISGVANGAALNTWASRLPATESFTQSTSARRPVYQANGQSSQACVSFTASQQHWMIRSGGGAYIGATTATYAIVTCGVLYTQTSNNSMMGGINDAAWIMDGLFLNSMRIVTASPAAGLGVSAPGETRGVLEFGRKDVNEIYARYGLGQFGTATGSGTSVNLAANRNGNIVDNFTQGSSLAKAIAVFNSRPTNALLNRIASSYFYSFKLQSA